jgi:hypothetical protein
MPDYQKAKIYKIYSVSNEELVYYGSTTKTLSSRLANHVYEYNKNMFKCNSKLIFDAGDYKIELVENYPCVNKQQLVKKEGEYIRNNVCVNKYIPDRTPKEYYDDNREYITKRDKEKYKNNKEEINEKAKEKITCECGCIISKRNLATHKKTNKHLKLIQ